MTSGTSLGSLSQLTPDSPRGAGPRLDRGRSSTHDRVGKEDVRDGTIGSNVLSRWRFSRRNPAV
jgi:hypothetical protein